MGTPIHNKHSFEKAFNVILQQIATTHTYYDYSLSVYTGTDNKIIIICPEHGKFEQTPYLHFKRGSVCPKCAKNNFVEKRKTKVSEFIKKS